MTDTETRRKVLVVEDAEATWTVQERMLIAAGFNPLVCTNGVDALEAIAVEDFDLVVLDLGLPEVDGWAILGRLRAEPRTASVPVLIVTARDDAETLQRARLAGANGYLAKPFDVGKFRKAVNELVDVA
jgi:DNA-binding response OmpR family regulator